MQLLLVVLVALLHCILPACANVEKVIFLGPYSAVDLYQSVQEFQSPFLDLLSPSNSTVRRVLQSKSPSSSRGNSETWMLLNGLNEGQRYEVRICWSATQPTAFDLNVYHLSQVKQDPLLFENLQSFLKTRQELHLIDPETSQGTDTLGELDKQPQGRLLLRIAAIADYYTLDSKLLAEGLPVRVDIILDQFVVNAIPKSLLPTGLYILVLATIAWHLSELVYRFLDRATKLNDSTSTTSSKEKKFR